MRLVIIESPFAGSKDASEAVRRIEVQRNIAYARACMADCFARGEAPFTSHLLYTQEGVLDDAKSEERQRGIDAGFAWAEAAQAQYELAHDADVPASLPPTRAFYVDLGVSVGMQKGIDHARDNRMTIEERLIGKPWTESPKALSYDFMIANERAISDECHCGHPAEKHGLTVGGMYGTKNRLLCGVPFCYCAKYSAPNEEQHWATMNAIIKRRRAKP